jgi:hypothetical protein
MLFMKRMWRRRRLYLFYLRNNLPTLPTYLPTTITYRFIKVSMMDIFGRPKKKSDGEDSKIKELPDVREVC